MDRKKSGFVVWFVNPNRVGAGSVASAKVQSVDLFMSSDTTLLSVSVQTNSAFYPFPSPTFLFSNRLAALKTARNRAVDALAVTKKYAGPTVSITSDNGLIPVELDGFQDLLAELDKEIAAEIESVSCKAAQE
jgi:hypothetical protein